MKKACAMLSVLLLLATLLSTPMQGADKRVLGAAAYGFLTVGESWADFTGATGVTFVFDTIGPGTGVCLGLVNNNTTNSRTVNLAAAQTSALSTTTFISNQGAWNTVPITPNQTSFTIPAFSGASVNSGILQVFIRAAGAAHLALTVSNESGTAGGSPDTLTIQYAWSGSSCGAINSWQQNNINCGSGSNCLSPVQAGITGVRHVVNCATGSVTSGGTASTTTFEIRDGGSSANCTTGTVLWSQNLATSSTTNTENHFEVCGLNVSGTAGNAIQMCSTLGITGALQSFAITGFDQ